MTWIELASFQATVYASAGLLKRSFTFGEMCVAGQAIAILVAGAVEGSVVRIPVMKEVSCPFLFFMGEMIYIYCADL